MRETGRIGDILEVGSKRHPPWMSQGPEDKKAATRTGRGFLLAGCLGQFTVIGMPINGQRIKTANPTTTISMMLAGMPWVKNSPLENCLDS